MRPTGHTHVSFHANIPRIVKFWVKNCKEKSYNQNGFYCTKIESSITASSISTINSTAVFLASAAERYTHSFVEVMKIHFNCPNCATAYTAEENQIGHRGKCKKCGCLITVPGQSGKETRPQSTEIDSTKNQMMRTDYLKNLNKKVIVFSLLFLCLVLIGFFGWQWYTSRPEYAVFQIRKAVDSSNRLKFEKYVDVDRFSQDVVDEFFDGAVQTSFSELGKDGWSMLGNLISKKIAESMKPNLVRSLSSEIIKAVSAGNMKLLWERTNPDTANLQVNPETLAKNSGLTAETIFKVGKMEKGGDRAYLPLNFYDEKLDTTFAIRIDIRRENKVWRVVGVEDLSEFIIESANLRKARLAEINERIKRYLSSKIKVGNFTKREIGENYWGPKYIKFEYQITNKTESTIKSGLIRMPLPSDASEDNLPFVIVDPIPPYGTGQAINAIEYNNFIDWHKYVRETFLGFFTPEVVYLVTVKSGHVDTTKIVESWQEYISFHDKEKGILQ